MHELNGSGGSVEPKNWKKVPLEYDRGSKGELATLQSLVFF